ncbi:unnamed protein product [Ophioblennius macclurei]
MYDLTAQVTSSLLPFSGVTLDALGEDEINLDSILHGKFTVGRGGLAWLACGPHLEVVHAVTGERLSAYCFSGGGEHPPSILTARDFSWLKRSGLLVGLEESEGSVLCLYDLALSRVVKAVLIPGRITAIEPLVSYGGASTLTQHLHQSLRWFFGIAAIVTDLGHVLLVDLCLDDLSCSQSELEASDLQVVTKSPAEIPRLREVSTREARHLCLQLNAPTGVGASAVQYISRTNQLAVGFSDGDLQLWNMKTLKKEYHSQLEGGRVPVYAFTFQEPENDPRNCCYLWAVQSSQDLEGDVVSLHLLQLAFSERKCLSSGKILYEGLEYCEERYSQDLNGTAIPLRAQATNTRLLNCLTIEKFRAHPDRDDSMNEVASPDTSVSIFSWQVRVYGQGTPTTYIWIFDINRWYHAQMPDSLRPGESLQNCPYLAIWSLDPVVQMVSPHVLIDVVVHERSLSRGLPFTCPPPEQYFNPTTYNFDASCLINSGIVHLTCSGYQKETISFLKKAAPCSSDIISTSYSHCLMSGLLSSRLADTQASSLSQEEQLDAILSTAVETSSLGLITGCIKQWTAEEHPGSSLNLRYILDWAWNKVVQTKQELDSICAPLFDSSSNFTDPQTLQLLQHSQRLLSNLSAIFHCLLSEAQELTQKGLAGLVNKNMVSSLVSRYAQVVLWFCRTGLLPEGSDDDALQIPRPFYTHSVISSYYTIRREELTRLAKGKWSADCLMIDGLISQCGERLTDLWKRDEGGTGQYPPPTLHALLDIYLLENVDETTKHAIVIYLLLDVMYSFPNKDGASVESFPTAFAIPIGLVKLVQGLWLLDHHDHQSSFELLLHPAASQCHFEWQHERVLQALMCQGQQSVALRYFHVTKPPISTTSQAKLSLSVLLNSRCLLEAWCLLRQHSNRLNMSELLGFMYESCQELGLIKELLKLPLGLHEQECLEKFLQGTGGLQNRELLMVHYLQQANYIPALQLNQTLKMNMVNERDPKLKERTINRNSIMDQYSKILPRVQRKLAMERAKPYQHPSTVHREVSRPRPLSTITKRSTNEKVLSRAGFINNVLTKIEEVWLGKGPTLQSSPSRRVPDTQNPTPKSSSLGLSEPFLGTPITMTSKQKSRLMDLVVQPSYQCPQPLHSPPSPWVSPKFIGKAPELNLLQTPQIVKRARALAASGPVFSGFTPQSILRSSLRPTPVATPSASPGRSITPPLSRKESRITFIEEAESLETEKGIHWTNGVAADSEIGLLTRGALSKATHKSWTSQPTEEEEDRDEEEEQPHVKFLPPEGGIPSPLLRSLASKASSVHEGAAETKLSDARLSLSFNTSQPSADTTLEYFDAPLSKEADQDGGTVATNDDDDNILTVNIKPLTDQSIPATEEIFQETLEDKQEEKEDERFEDIQQEEKEETQCDTEHEQEFLAPSAPDELSIHLQVPENTECGAEVESKELPLTTEEKAVKSEDAESSKFHEQLETFEATETISKAAEDQDQSADLTEFVQRHLFGGDLSSPLTRSGIHSASQAQASFNSESLVEDEEEEQPSAEPLPVFTTQKSTVSLTSSEAAGTDSHSVVSVNDSEELSSPASDEEEEEEEEEEEVQEEEEEEEDQETEEEEDEDSGSEVEIIEEVQGNGRLPPLQAHTHFLPALSEQEAAEFSLIPPAAEMKMVEEEMEGEVVMVQLSAEDGEVDPDSDVDQVSSYMELKPSTTLLVPFELVEGHHGLADNLQMGLPELHESIVMDQPLNETENDFSLMLDMDEDREKESGTVLPVENDPTTLSEVETLSEDILARAQGFLVPQSEEASPEDDKEMESLNGNGEDGPRDSELVTHTKDLQTGSEQEAEDAAEQEAEELQLFAEDHEVLTVSKTALVEEIPEMRDNKNSVEETVPQPPEVVKNEAALEMAETPEAVDDRDSMEKIELPETVEQTDISEAMDDMDSVVKVELPEAVEDEDCLEKTETPAVVDEIDSAQTTELLDTVEKTDILEAVDDLNSVEKTDALDEEMREEDKLLPAEEPKEPEKNENINTEIIPSAETELALTEEEEEPVQSAEAEQRSADETEMGSSKDQNVKLEISSTDNMPDKPAPETPSQRKKTSSTPTQRTTRSKRTVTFISHLEEKEEQVSKEKVTVEGNETSTLFPATPRRTPRKGKQSKEAAVPVRTPRRSARKSHSDLTHIEVEDVAAVDTDAKVATASKASSPARRSQRATATRASQKTGSDDIEPSVASDVEINDEDRESEVTEVKVSRRTSSRTRTPAKKGTVTVQTPRRSSRRILTSTDESLEISEEKEQGVVHKPVKRSSRKTKFERPEVLPNLLEEDDYEEQNPSSPKITVPRSNRISLNLYPQVKLAPLSLPQSLSKMRPGTIPENRREKVDLLKPQLDKKASQTPNTRRTTRGKLWDRPEEVLPRLDPPLEVTSEFPVADALIKRLQDEEMEEEVVTKTEKSSKRRTKFTDPVKDEPLPKPEDEESNLGEHSYIYSPSRRQTRSHRVESPDQVEELMAPVTRSRRVKGAAVQDLITSEDDHVLEDKTASVSKMSRRTTKSKAVVESIPVAEVKLLSPLPSPADPIPRALRRLNDAEVPTTTRNLRRKRVIDTVFTKPVTRRKKL